MSTAQRRHIVRAMASALLGVSTMLHAGEIGIQGAGGNFTIRVDSLKEQRWRATVKQRYDFSCGSAAIATLLTFHYEQPAREDDIFREMIAQGDAAKIRSQGFSMLDLKRYLDGRELDTDGFKLTLDQWAQLAVPGVVLLNMQGYRHFVVVKGIRGDRVLLGDPSRGAVSVSRAAFESWWNGVGLIARARARVARAGFNRPRDWSSWSQANLEAALDRSTLGLSQSLLPNLRELGL